jgi:branched-chain amino acid transport system ATP-binding protein
VAQEREVFASPSVEENLTVAARPGRWDLGRHLSGGEQQMLAIARALIHVVYRGHLN